MEIEIEQSKLTRALNAVSKVAMSTRSGLPILSNVMLRAEDKQLILTTTNLEIAVVEYINAKIKKEGTITVPAKLLAEFVSNLPKEKIELIVKNEKLEVKSGKYRSVMNGIVADDFPELPTIDEKAAVRFKIGVDFFKEAISEVIIASSTDTTRPALTGVFLNTVDKTLYIAATDGYRLADKKFVNKVESEIKAIVPASSLQEVLRLITDDDEEIEILIIDTQIRFRLSNVELTSKLIDASFPDYKQLIPKDIKTNLILDKNEFSRMVRAAKLFAQESGGSIICEAKADDNSFTVSAVASELGENSASMEVEVNEDARVVLNSNFVLQALNATESDKVQFGFSGKLAPVVVKNEKNEDYTHIIMPLKS